VKLSVIPQLLLTMEISSICEALQNTLSNEKSKRDNATAFISQAGAQPNFAPLLLQIIVSDAVENIKLAATIQLKNIIAKKWMPDDEKTEQLAEADKVFLRAGIFQAMGKCHSKAIIKVLKFCISVIADKDFPDIWPELIIQLKAILVNPVDKKVLHDALSITSILAKLFRYQKDNKMTEIEPLMNELLTALYQLALKILANPSEDSALFLFPIGKALVNSIYMEMTGQLMEEGSLENWCVILKTMFEWPVPPKLSTPTDDEEEIKARSKHKVYKVKDIAAQFFYNLIDKYGGSSENNREYNTVIKIVEEKLSLGILEMFIKYLKNTSYINPKTLLIAFKVLKKSILNPCTTKIIYPLLEDLLVNCAFPRVIVTKKMLTLWNEDQITFVNDYLEGYFDVYEARYAAIVFIQTACSHSKYGIFKDNKIQSHPILESFLAFLGKVVQESEKNPWTFEAALYIIEKLHLDIKSYKYLLDQVETMLIQLVLPNLSNPIGMIRMRSCIAFDTFASIKFNDVTGKQIACEKLIQSMKDKDLPVRVAASLAVSNYIEEKVILNKLKPYALELISIYLELIRIVANDSLVLALKKVVVNFDKEIQGYAITLIKEMMKIHEKLSATCSTDQSDCLITSRTAIFYAIDTIEEIVKLIKDDRNLLQQSKGLIFPLIYKEIWEYKESTLEDQIEYVSGTSSCIEILDCYVCKLEGVCKELWNILPVILEGILGSISEEGNLLQEIPTGTFKLIQHYIIKDPDTFCTQGNANVKYIEMLFRLIQKIIHNAKKSGNELDATHGITLLLTILEALKV